MLGDEYIEFEDDLLPLELNVMDIDANDCYRYQDCYDETEVDLANLETNFSDEIKLEESKGNLDPEYVNVSMDLFTFHERKIE